MSKFKFDKKTGTLVKVEEEAPIIEKKNTGVARPIFRESKEIPITPNRPNVEIDEGEVKFKALSDYTIMQVVSERTGSALAYIGGYALEIKFNMAELNTINKVEECLEGLKRMFRKFIVDQALAGDSAGQPQK